MFKPAIIQSLKNYNTKTFYQILLQVSSSELSPTASIAFAIASGASPERGNIT